MHGVQPQEPPRRAVRRAPHLQRLLLAIHVLGDLRRQQQQAAVSSASAARVGGRHGGGHGGGHGRMGAPHTCWKASVPPSCRAWHSTRLCSSVAPVFLTLMASATLANWEFRLICRGGGAGRVCTTRVQWAAWRAWQWRAAMWPCACMAHTPSCPPTAAWPPAAGPQPRRPAAAPPPAAQQPRLAAAWRWGVAGRGHACSGHCVMPSVRAKETVCFNSPRPHGTHTQHGRHTQGCCRLTAGHGRHPRPVRGRLGHGPQPRARATTTPHVPLQLMHAASNTLGVRGAQHSTHGTCSLACARARVPQQLLLCSPPRCWRREAKKKKNHVVSSGQGGGTKGPSA